MKFWALTVSMLPMAQDLFYRLGREKDTTLLPAALERCAQEQPDSGRLKLGRVQRAGQNLIGLYSKREIAHLYDENFTRHDQPSYPPRLWIWDHDEQTLLVQVDVRVFADAEAASRQFAALLAPALAENQLEVRIYPKVAEEQFWSAVREFASLTTVTFEYATPNMFGSTKAEMTAFLRQVRDSTNATVLKTTLENDEGELHPKPDGLIKRALDWIQDGGGQWRIKGRLRPGARPSVRRSGKQATVYQLPTGALKVETSGYSASDIATIISALRPEYTYRREDDR